MSFEASLADHTADLVGRGKQAVICRTSEVPAKFKKKLLQYHFNFIIFIDTSTTEYASPTANNQLFSLFSLS